MNSARPLESRSSSAGSGACRKELIGAHCPSLARTNAATENVRIKCGRDILQVWDNRKSLTSLERRVNPRRVHFDRTTRPAGSQTGRSAAFTPCHYPHLRRNFLTKANADLHRPHSGDHSSDGLKPRRGGLFIATDAPKIVLFVFRRRGNSKGDPTGLPASKQALRTEMVRVPRRRKTKRSGTLCVLPYKQATPTGFAIQPAISKPQTGPQEMWVMTRRLRRFIVGTGLSLGDFRGSPFIGR
jgi:hypothetical protein